MGNQAKYCIDGQPFTGIPTALIPGSIKYFLDGQPADFLNYIIAETFVPILFWIN